MSPMVSVCVPTYNRASLLRDSINSILNQTYRDYELIISDNASTDETEDIVNSFKDERIIYSRNKSNIGLRKNWSKCLSIANGKYISIFPDDDLMLPENIEKKVDILSKNSRLGLVHSKYHIIDIDGIVTKANTNWGHGPERFFDVLEDRDFLFGNKWNLINAPTVMLKRECYHTLGDFTDKLNFAFDYEYWLRIATRYDIAFLAEPLVQWRVHPDTMTVKNFSSDQVFRLSEDWAAKRIALNNYGRALDHRDKIMDLVLHNMSERLIWLYESMIENKTPQDIVIRNIFKVIKENPNALRLESVWKVVLKTMLSKNNIHRLKKVYALIK